MLGFVQLGLNEDPLALFKQMLINSYGGDGGYVPPQPPVGPLPGVSNVQVAPPPPPSIFMTSLATMAKTGTKGPAASLPLRPQLPPITVQPPGPPSPGAGATMQPAPPVMFAPPAPGTQPPATTTKPFYKKGWFWGLVAVGTVAAGAGIYAATR